MNIEMKSVTYRILATMIFAGIINVQPALAQTELTDTWLIAEGGKLYDNWSKVVYYDSTNLPTHPAYPKTGKQKGEVTWRCKECHGWDYKGKDGAYAKGSHFTGIKGIRDFVGMAPDRIVSVIRDKTHGYTEAMIPNRALSNIARFVNHGQLDTDKYVDRATKKTQGNATRGARFFQTICAICHGFDGKQVNFRTPENPEFIGTVANENPWETLHKIRNGQPGIPMVSLGMLDIQDQVDILSYCQTLPQK
jgi:thiosulfate dehydrogenase